MSALSSLRHARRIALIGTAVLFAMLCWLLAVAYAHDPHPGWMMDGRYKHTPSGQHCCSANRDCLPIADDAVLPAQRGWRYLPAGEFIPEANVFPSRDGRHWRCAFPGGRTRCLFIGGTS